MGYYPTFKGRKLTQATTGKNFEDIVPGEISQIQKDKYGMISLKSKNENS